jgi:hypothetical protein
VKLYTNTDNGNIYNSENVEMIDDPEDNKAALNVGSLD